ncbi:MAG: hypothetical protein OXT67_05585 [Zetaproteobacteria bacterium]|nr:hypothetical protein [Zetaproteobacteria bacterium]
MNIRLSMVLCFVMMFVAVGCTTLDCLSSQDCPVPPRVLSLQLGAVESNLEGLLASLNVVVDNPNPVSLELARACACVRVDSAAPCLVQGQLLQPTMIKAASVTAVPLRLRLDWKDLRSLQAPHVEICADYAWTAGWWFPVQRDIQCKSLQLPTQFGAAVAF